MDFIDDIEKKVYNKKEEEYLPQEYEFSDGEGFDEDDLRAMNADQDNNDNESNSDQEGFDDLEDYGEEEEPSIQEISD